MNTPRLSRGLRYLAAAAGLLIVLALTVTFVAVIVLDDDNYRSLAIWGVAKLGGTRMAVDGAFEVEWSRELRLTATGIRLEAAPDGEPPGLKTIGRIHVRIDLPRLLRGILLVKDLEVADLLFIHLTGAGDDAAPVTLSNPLGVLTPVVERVALEDLHVRIARPHNDRVDEIMLNKLTLDDVDNRGPLFLRGGGHVNSNAFNIAGRMGGTLDLYDRSRPFPIDLNFTIADLEASLTGAIDHPLEGQGFRLDLRVEEQELANLIRLFQPDIPALGRFGFTAAIAGDIEALQITDLDLEISNGAGIQISAEGSVPDLATGRGTAVDIQQAIENSSLLAWLFPDDWKVVEEFRLSGALRHADGSYTIENIDARVANDKGIVLTIDGNLSLGNPTAQSFTPALNLNLQITSPDTAGIKPLLTDAIPEIGGVRARARLVGPLDHLALEDLAVDRGGSGPVQVTTRGRIGRIPLEDDAPLEDMDFTFGLQAENSRILREFYEIPMGELGRVDLSGRFTGSSRRFQLQEVELTTRTTEGLETHVAGQIDFKTREDGKVIGDLDFKLNFSSPTLGKGEPLLGLQIMRPLGPISGEADVVGTTQELAFENILATGGQPERLYAEWRGRINSVPLTEKSVSSGHETYGSLFAARSSDFAALFNIDLPDVGPVRASWRDTDRDGVLGMDDIDVVIGDGQRFDLRASGKIDNIIDQNQYARFEEEQIEYQGVDFRFDLKTADSHGIAKLIGLSMPDLGPFSGTWRLTGGEKGLAVSNIDVRSRSAKGLEITASGDVPQIDVIGGGGVREIDVQLAARAPDIGATPWSADRDLPDLGALLAEARLKNNGQALELDTIKIRTGPATRPTLAVDAALRNIDTPQQIELEASFDTGLRPWLQKAFDKSSTANPRVQGAVALSRTDDHLKIDQLRMHADEAGGLNVEAGGTVALNDATPRVDLQVRSDIPEPAAWGTMMGVAMPDLASTRVAGWYRETADEYIFTGDIRLGESRFQTDFHSVKHSPKLRIEATMAAQTLRLKDLGFYPEGRGVPAPEERGPDGQATAPLFSDKPLNLSALNDFDLTLKILADRMEAREHVFKKVGLDVAVHDGRLQVGPTTVEYLHGTSTIDAFVDTNRSPPVMGLNMAIEDADLEEVLTSVDQPLILGGKMTLFADLHSGGYSAREMAANLQGEIGFVIEEGRIQRKVELLASDALDFLFTGPARKGYTDLDCTAFRMLFQDGVGTIQVFFVETPGMRAETFGHIDLGDESLALIINPRSKRRIIRRSSPVRLSGPLQDPSVSKVPAEEAAILAGQILVPVVALPARALGFLWSLISRDKPGDCFIPPEDTP
ncbi:MAG: AsmA family protein [Desulfobacterales bacterium]|nr:AsmA family protein [Desulfobacterales bacterium]